MPVECGFPNKDKIVIREKGNEHPEARTGDLVVIVTIKPDATYKRVKDDLYITKKISLIEALSGIAFNLEHINEHKITIKTKANKII